MTKDQLKHVIHDKSLSRLDVLVILLSVDANYPKQVKDIKELAYSGGLRKIKGWNISDVLGRSSGLAVRTPDGWELSMSGLERARELGADSGPIVDVNGQLRSIAEGISEDETKEFVREAIKCLESKHLRAAVVLSWVGAVSVMHKYVVDNRLSDFNNEATRRNSKWKPAMNADDLGKMKENDFLQILESLSEIGKNVKQELEACLKLRNSCGHPNSLKISESRVAAHIEILVLNVFSRF